MIDVVDKNLSIARIERLEEERLEFANIENVEVYDETGNCIRVGDIYRTKRTILVLVRHFLCFMCKEYVDDLGLISEKCLQEADVQLVVIGCAEWKFIKPFREATGYHLKLYVDPDRKLYKALRCKDSIFNYKPESKHVKSGVFSGLIQSLWRGMQYCELQGDTEQQGGAFILGPGNVCHFVHRDMSPTDHTPINDLLVLAGLDQINFAKDKRVLTV